MDNKTLATATKGLGAPKKSAAPEKKSSKKAIRMAVEQIGKGFVVENHEQTEDGMPGGKMTKHLMMGLNDLHKHLDTHYGPGEADTKPENMSNDKMAQPEGKPAPAAGAKEA